MLFRWPAQESQSESERSLGNVQMLAWDYNSPLGLGHEMLTVMMLMIIMMWL
jgi:hypothetical protein